ncbi:hypothetical protein Tsubulata_023541, partial [Turnera subulata]
CYRRQVAGEREQVTLLLGCPAPATTTGGNASRTKIGERGAEAARSNGSDESWVTAELVSSDGACEQSRGDGSPWRRREEEIRKGLVCGVDD